MLDRISMQLGEKPRLDWIDLDLIDVDHNYQRDLKPKRVAKILRDFQWSKFGTLQLSEKPDGRFNVYDGQHRLDAARKHPAIDAVPTVIVILKQGCDEASAFLGVNIERSAITTVEKYHAGIEAGDLDMMQVCSVLEEAGCEVVQAIGIKPAANRTTAVTAVQRAIKSYGEAAVTSACKTLVAAWSRDPGALHGVMIGALSRLYRNNKDMDAERMVARLKTKDRKILTVDAETIRKIGGGDAALNVSKTLVEVYNRGLSTNMIQIGARK